jgi:O-methyltransferase
VTASPPPTIATRQPADLYLELLKATLTRAIAPEEFERVAPYERGFRSRFRRWLLNRLGERDLILVRPRPVDPAARAEGRDWPIGAETMVGLRRLDNLQHCLADVVARGVPGDVIETGVWRGGAMIFARAVLEALGDAERVVWCADSFAGLPRPDPDAYPADEGDVHHSYGQLAVPLEQVRANFARYGLLDERVRFLPGWFRDTLPTAPVERLAVLRLDGDMYESTIVALDALFPKLSVGGYVVVDDYGAAPACRHAVDDFRRDRGIADPIHEVDWTGVYWQRTA